MIGFFPIPFLIGLVLLGMVIIRLWQQKHPRSHLFAVSLFGLYLLLLIDAVIFYIPATRETGPIITIQNIKFTLSRVNLIPLFFGDQINPYYLSNEIFYNIMLTVPFGFGINFLLPLRRRKVFWIATVVGCSTELSQLLVSLFIVGGPYRSVDINDVILNTLGVWLGIALFHLARRLFPALQKWIRQSNELRTGTRNTEIR